MRAFAIMLTLLTVFGGAGCRRKQCLPTCEQRARELQCGRPYKCKEECEDLSKRTVCRAELDAFAACFLEEPKENWECDEEAKPAPKQTVCVNQRQAVGACLDRAYMSPNPPKTL